MGAAQPVGINLQEAVGQKTCVFTSMGNVTPEICLENALAGTFVASERRAIHENDALAHFNRKGVTSVTDFGSNVT